MQGMGETWVRPPAVEGACCFYFFFLSTVVIKLKPNAGSSMLNY